MAALDDVRRITRHEVAPMIASEKAIIDKLNSMDAARSGCTTIIDHHASPACADGSLDVVERDDAGRVRYHYVIVDLDATYQGGDLCSGDDALEARWVAEAEMAGLDVSLPTRKLLSGRYHFGCAVRHDV